MPIDAKALARVGRTGRKAAIGNIVKAGFGHKSVGQVRASERLERSAPLDISKVGPKSIIVNEGRIQAAHSGGGWAKVNYVDPVTRRTVTFNMRTTTLREALGQRKNRWYDPATAVYAKWIKGTRAGQLYSARRQVEGMLKTALKKGDMEMAGKLEQILAMSDEKVLAFRQEWEKAMSDAEVEQFYTYEDTVDNTPAVTVWE